MYLLVDCNNFFVSCERVFRPDLRGKPVAILSNNDGCIVSRSNEVKALGIKMGVPVFKVRDQLKAHDVTVFSSNYELYADISARIMAMLASYTPHVELYSVDEAFLYVESAQHLDVLARQIRCDILKCVGVPVSVGVGPTKTLAKLASELAKQIDEGVWIFETPPGKVTLSRLPVETAWGLGRRSCRRLLAHRVKTLWDFLCMPASLLRKTLNVNASRLQKELQGVSCYDLADGDESQKSVLSSRSFGEAVSSVDALKGALANNISVAARKLRKRGLLAHTLLIFIRTSRHKSVYYSNSVSTTFSGGTDSVLSMVGVLDGLLRQIYKPDMPYMKTGVLLLHLTPKSLAQMPLFDALPVDDAVLDVMDAVNKGRRTPVLTVATTQLERQKTLMKQGLRSPRYTTALGELATVYCK